MREKEMILGEGGENTNLRGKEDRDVW